MDGELMGHLILPRRRLLLAAPAIIAARSSDAQMLQAITNAKTAAAAAGFVFKQSKTGSGQNTFTTTAADYTGCDLIAVAYATGGVTPTLTSSPANTWTASVAQVSNVGNGFKTGLLYSQAPSVSASMTFTLTGSSQFAALVAYGFSGSIATPLDGTPTTNSNSGNTTISPSASFTPAHANEVLLTCLGTNDTAGNTHTLNTSGGTWVFATNNGVQQSGSNQGIFMAYVIQTTAVAAQPTWTVGVGSVSGLNTILAGFRSV